MTKHLKIGALDSEGHPIKMSRADMMDAIDQVAKEGDLLAVIFRKEGSVLMKLFFNPNDCETNEVILAALQSAVESMKTILRGLDDDDGNGNGHRGH